MGHDVHIRCRINRARIETQHGHHGRAQELAIDACTRADLTDWLNLRGHARLCLAEVHAAQDREDDAGREFARAQVLFEPEGERRGGRDRSRRAQAKS
jgi:hypothetical protein